MEFKSFIKKPVLSSVISILIVVAGVIGLTSLPIEQYPDIAPPMVCVSTTYYGASAKTVQNAVVAPIEDAINGVEHMTYMVSTTDNAGNCDITVYFEQGTNPDMNAVNVQNRVSKAMSQLPAEVKQYGVQTAKQMNSMLQIFAISSPDDKYDSQFLGNYLNINIKPKILRIHGISKFTMFGADYSMRIWLKPEAMHSFNLDPEDVFSALAEQNIESATGSFGENTSEQVQYTMVYKGRLKTIEEFENIIIRVSDNGEILRLGNVADVELGTEQYVYDSKVDGHPGAVCVCYQTSGSNATQINEDITALLKECEPTLPSGTKIDVLMNTNDFLYASMHSVIETLLEAIVLVILIVLLFLHDFRSTLIPFIGILVSLIGTFAFMLMVGFSLNLITLFALVLVIGTVVDDAIVVVEAVHEKLDAGYTSTLKASIDAMSEISTAVITSSLVFMAVFIPVSFMGGTTGLFFRQFGLTMAVAVGISAINALTLSPALCAILLKPKRKDIENLHGYAKYKAKFSASFNAGFDRLSEKYRGAIKPLIKHPWISFLLIAGFCVLMVWSMRVTPTGFVPQEDTCKLMCDVIMPPSTSKAVTTNVADQIAKEIMEIPDIQTVGQINGNGFTVGLSSAAASFVLALKPWEEREFMSVYNVAAQVSEIGSKYKDATVIPFLMPMIPGYGSSSDVEINLQDKVGGDLNVFVDYANQFLAELQNDPRVSHAYTSFTVDNPQWLVDVDIARCHQAGITANKVLGVLSAYCGGSYVNDINLYGKVYKVMVESAPESRTNERALNTMYVRTQNGQMSPLSNFITIKRVYGAETLKRFNMLNSIMANAGAAEGASSGDVIAAVKAAAAKVLPNDYTFEFGGMSREEESGSSMALIFGISALIIFLILAALYESYILPFSIMLTVPVAVAGAFFFSYIFGLENNIYLQVGVIMLIGLISKTGILITEFAVQLRRERGYEIKDAALEAAKMRLRPIFMTAGTMVVGMIPLMISRGAGAVGNISLSTGVVFGMVMGTIGLLLLVPAFFVIFENLQEKIKPINKEEEEM